MSIRLICALSALCLAFGQLFTFAGPALAQGYPLQNYISDPRAFGYNRGYGTFPGYAGYSPYTTGPQYGYSAWGSRTMPSRAAGTAIGLGMYGGIVGIGALSMASRMIANRKYSQAHNNPKGNQKLASKDRRQTQELKIRGEMDSDYQKELSEKGMLPPTAQLPPAAGFRGPGSGSFGGAPSASSPAMSMGGSGASPAGNAAPAANYSATPAAEPVQAPVYNATPWSPTGDGVQPSF